MAKPGKVGFDGIVNHPKAKENCGICHGGGWLDDGHQYACWLVPCPCTGEADKKTITEVKKSYPKAFAALKNTGHVSRT
jgi:hypothetical protein